MYKKHCDCDGQGIVNTQAAEAFETKRSAKMLCMMLLCVILFSGCRENAGTVGENAGQKESALHDRKDCPLEELLDYLDEESSGIPYAYARVLITVDNADVGEEEKDPEKDAGDMAYRQDVIKLQGTADISWDTFSSAEEFQEYFSVKEQEQSALTESGEAYMLELAYYQYQLGEGIHASDLNRYLKEIYDEEENPLYAITMDGMRPKSSYCFSQSGIREMVVVGDSLYGLEWKSSVNGENAEDVRELLMAYSIHKQGVQDIYYNGWVMREEILYWIDHEERISNLEDPDRSFTEVKGRDTAWEGVTYMESFGLLKEAEYRVRLCETGPLLGLHFSFAEEIPESGYEAYLSNGFCTDENYKMTVTDLDTDEILQTQDVKMSIEMIDAVTFTDLDGDGYLDMQIDIPVHGSGEEAGMDEFGKRSFLLWDRKKKPLQKRAEKRPRKDFLNKIRIPPDNRKKKIVLRYMWCSREILYGESPEDFTGWENGTRKLKAQMQTYLALIRI